MPVENEFKFVLDPHAARWTGHLSAYPSVLIEQVYTPKGGRFRRIVTGTVGRPPVVEHVFTFKEDMAGRLLEIECDVSAADFQMASAGAESRLSKRRWKFGDTVGETEIAWDVDVMLGTDGAAYFAMAEAEVPERVRPDESGAFPFPIPAWLEPFVIHRVPQADNARFTNARLVDPAYAATLLKSLAA